MECHEAQDVIHAYFDGELDLVRTLDLESHIQNCQSCARARQALVALRGAIRGGGLYYKAPAALAQRIRAGIETKFEVPTIRRTISFGWRGMAIAASLAFVALAVWVAVWGAKSSDEKLLVQEIRASHVRSLMEDHLVDVKSSDQHTVKPWFDGKLDFAPEVKDFKADSFALMGGRLEYLEGRSAAALVYEHGKHRINLFIWPVRSGGEQSAQALVRDGYVMIHWARGGMNYWAISDTDEPTLRRFGELVRGERAPAATKP
jgi:anti-sigma factor RsiW